MLLGRMSAMQAAIAIANKTARIAWAIMVHGGVYDAGYAPSQYRAEACAAHRISGSAMGDRRSGGARLQRQRKEEHAVRRYGCGGADGMMLIGRSSRWENLLRVTGCRAHKI